jgi:hypothetical protein
VYEIHPFKSYEVLYGWWLVVVAVDRGVVVVVTGGSWTVSTCFELRVPLKINSN